MVVVVLLVLVSVLIGLLCLFMGATTRLSYLCSGRPLRWSELFGGSSGFGRGWVRSVDFVVRNGGFGPELLTISLLEALGGFPARRETFCAGSVVMVGDLQLYINCDLTLFACYTPVPSYVVYRRWLVLGCWDLREPGSLEEVVGFVRAYDRFPGGNR